MVISRRVVLGKGDYVQIVVVSSYEDGYESANALLMTNLQRETKLDSLDSVTVMCTKSMILVHLDLKWSIIVRVETHEGGFYFLTIIDIFLKECESIFWKLKVTPLKNLRNENSYRE